MGMSSGDGRLPSHLAVAAENPLVAAEAFHAHGAACMQLVCRNTHFGAETVFATVGEAGARVHHHAAAVHICNKVILHGSVFSDHGFGVAAAVRLDVVAGFGDVVHELDAGLTFDWEFALLARGAKTDVRASGFGPMEDGGLEYECKVELFSPTDQIVIVPCRISEKAMGSDGNLHPLVYAAYQRQEPITDEQTQLSVTIDLK